MSYMNQSAFAPVGGIQELSFDEIDLVDGAISMRDVGNAARWVAGGAAIVGGVALISGNAPVAAGAAIVGGTALLVAAAFGD